MSYTADVHERRTGPWCQPPYAYGYRRVHPGAFIVMVLAFIFWWPLGLAMLAFILWSKGMMCWNGDRWHHKMQRMEDKMERLRGRMERWGGSPSSSGNKAFDEYRTDTLHRLEEEEREFREFLERLRAAKDKAEFDQFMADRRNRPQPSAPPA
jgi:hypothetical protein